MQTPSSKHFSCSSRFINVLITLQWTLFTQNIYYFNHRHLEMIKNADLLQCAGASPKHFSCSLSHTPLATYSPYCIRHVDEFNHSVMIRTKDLPGDRAVCKERFGGCGQTVSLYTARINASSDVSHPGLPNVVSGQISSHSAQCRRRYLTLRVCFTCLFYVPVRSDQCRDSVARRCPDTDPTSCGKPYKLHLFKLNYLSSTDNFTHPAIN